MSTDEGKQETAAGADSAEPDAYRARLVAQLDRRFRNAGEGPETRLIYQVVLDFQMAQQSS